MRHALDALLLRPREGDLDAQDHAHGVELPVVSQSTSVTVKTAVIAHARYRSQRGESTGGPSAHATSQSLRIEAASVPTTAIASRKSSDAVSSVIAC